MAFFGKKTEGVLDVIRCDEENYLIWKWRPGGETVNSTRKENAIRWGSSLRVKDGEVAVFVYKQGDGTTQEFIEGPFDETIKTANFPIIANIIGLAYAGQSPFQAEVYFINLAGNQKMPFGIPYFDVFDNRFLDFPVRTTARGSIIFNVTDYRAFIKLHRLINFDPESFKRLVRDSVIKYVKGMITNAPADQAIPVLQIERKLLEINDLIQPRIEKAFKEDFGVNLKRFDLESIEVDKETEEYKELRSITANLEVAMRQKQNEVAMRGLDITQDINAENMAATMHIQRTEAQRFQRLQTESQHLTAHQINQQTEVLKAGANNLGAMSSTGGGSGGGMNPAGMMMGMALGGTMGGQMANMMQTSGQAIQTQMATPPPPPQSLYNVSVNGQSMGPFNLGQLNEMARNGQFIATHHVWKQGMANWESAGAVAELAPLFAPPPPPAPAP